MMIQKLIQASMDKAHKDFDYLVVSLKDMSRVLKHPSLFSNRVCIHAALMDIVKDHIDAGVIAARDLRAHSGQVFDDVLMRVEAFTPMVCGMDAAEISEEEFNDAKERLIGNIQHLIKCDRRVRHTRALMMRLFATRRRRVVKKVAKKP